MSSSREILSETKTLNSSSLQSNLLCLETKEANKINSPKKVFTLFYQGNSNSQVQVMKYIGNQEFKATTGEILRCEGRKNLKPLNVIFKPYIGKEIADVNLSLFNGVSSYLSPTNLLDACWSLGSAWLNGIKFVSTSSYGKPTVRYYGINRNKSSIGQETDINSFAEKYQQWEKEFPKEDDLIVYSVSRGTAATFCAIAKNKYPKIKLAIFEGAIDSVENVKDSVVNKFPSCMQSTVRFFGNCYFKKRYQAYSDKGPSPLSEVDNFPENLPAVFITSEADEVVPCKSTIRIAEALAARGKNPVYLLKLRKSDHANYMYHNEIDRRTYECFIHAIYKKYGFSHDEKLAKSGDLLLEDCLLTATNNNLSAKLTV